MSKRLYHKIIVEHIWRSLRALLLLLAVIVWLLQDGWASSDAIVLLLCFAAHMTEQFHGFVCNRIEKLFGWKQDFKDWE